MIRKSLNFIWVGDSTLRPADLIQSWAHFHPGWDLRIWDNDDLLGRPWLNAKHMRTMVQERQWCGVADLMRWELLYEVGGVFLDADSLCLQPLPDSILENDAFACWENELERPGLIATGYLGATAGNPFIARINRDITQLTSVSEQQAWACVGPKRLTDSWLKYRYDRLTLYPSHFFIPRHYSGRVYHGQGTVYADQAWGSTHADYASLRASRSGWHTGAVSVAPPKITVGVPTRNQAQWLMEALHSALSQDYADFEVLVVDDESEDDTPQVLASIQDPRVRVLRKAHTNLPDVRNLILKEAAGEYICWLDSDDILLPHTLAAYAERARDWPQVSVFYGDLLQIDASGRPVGPLKYDNHAGNRHLLARLFQRNHMPNPGSFVQTEAMRAIGGFDSAAEGSCDYDLWMRLAAQKTRFQHLGRTVLKYRWHGDNISYNPNIIRNTDLYLLGKMVDSIPLDHLCSDLPWHDFSRACEEAIHRVALLFRDRGDPRKANEWMSHTLMAKAAAQLVRTPSERSNTTHPGLPKGGRLTPLVWISNDLDEPVHVDPLAIRTHDHLTLEDPSISHAPLHMDLVPDHLIPPTRRPFSETSHKPSLPDDPPPQTLVREAFIYHPNWRGNAWVSVVMSYVAAFAPGEPVGLVLAWKQAGISNLSLQEAQDAVIRVISLLKRESVPDIVFVDQPEELLDVLDDYATVQWIPSDEVSDLPLKGAMGTRFSLAHSLLSQST